MKDDFGNELRPPATVAATTKLLTLLGDNFAVLEDFHPAFTDSITLVDQETDSAVTIVIVESSDKEDEA